MLCVALCAAALAATSPASDLGNGQNRLVVAQSAQQALPGQPVASGVSQSPALPAPVAPPVAAAPVAPVVAPLAPIAAPSDATPQPKDTALSTLQSLVLKSGSRAQAIAAFYEQRGGLPMWVAEDGRETVSGQALESALTQTALEQDLSPEDYVLPTKGSPAARELAFDQALIRLARALRQGAKPAPDAGQVLTSVASASDVKAAVDALVPQNPYYQRLHAALATYRTIIDNGGWPKISVGGKLRPGDRDPAIAVIRQRLVVTGDLTADDASKAASHPTLYDADLKAAVIRFQTSHGFAADGVIGAPTAAALAEQPAEVIAKLLLNLNRTRQIPDSVEAGDVLVNIPGFEAFLFDGGKVALRSRIIVGTNETATPDFSATIQDVIVNPPWNVPESIAAREILPKLAGNHGYLDSQNMVASLDGKPINPRKVDWQSVLNNGGGHYHFRQKSGVGNSLGRIKIQFPNDFDVYLHDTPKRSLFDRRVRAFSHGCMRVEKVVDLASALLGPEWPSARINEAIAKGDTKVIKVTTPRRVDVLYLTAWVDPETGVLQFRDDIYKHDVPPTDDGDVKAANNHP